MKQTYKEMNFLWIFVILSLLVGATLGYVFGVSISSKSIGSTGEANKNIWQMNLPPVVCNADHYSDADYIDYCNYFCGTQNKVHIAHQCSGFWNNQLHRFPLLFCMCQ